MSAEPYDFAQRLSDLCGAWDSQRRPIAAEILSEIARIMEARDRLHEGIEEYLLWRPGERGHAAAHHALAALSEAAALGEAAAGRLSSRGGNSQEPTS